MRGADLLEAAYEELFDAVRQGMLEVSIVPGYRDDSFLAATLTLTAVKPGTTLEFRRVVVLLWNSAAGPLLMRAG